MYFKRKVFPRSAGIYGWDLEQLLRSSGKASSLSFNPYPANVENMVSS